MRGTAPLSTVLLSLLGAGNALLQVIGRVNTGIRRVAWDVEAIKKRDDDADLGTRARLVNFWLRSKDLILEAWAVLLHVCLCYPSYLLSGWLVVAGRWMLWDATRKLWEAVLAVCWLVGWIAIAVCKPCLAVAASALSYRHRHVTRGVTWARGVSLWEVNLRELAESAGWILAAVGVCHLLYYLREIKEDVRREGRGDGGRVTTDEEERRNASNAMTHFAILAAGVVACFALVSEVSEHIGPTEVTNGSDSAVVGNAESVVSAETVGTDPEMSSYGANIFTTGMPCLLGRFPLYSLLILHRFSQR